MKLLIFFLSVCFLLPAAKALCPQLYGRQNPAGDWNFSVIQELGMLPVESDSNCLAQGGAYVLVNGAYKLDPALLAAKLAAEAKANADAKPVDLRTYQALLDKVIAQDAKIKALEDFTKLPK